MIFGFDEDTYDVFDESYKAMQEWQADAIELNILTPYPGTAIYNRFEKEGRILTKNWSQYSQAHVVYKPKLMTPEELSEGFAWVTKKYYSWYEIIKRSLKYLGYASSKEKSPSLLSIPTINLALRSYYKREINRIQKAWN